MPADLIQWSMSRGMKRLLAEYKEQNGPEAALRYFFVFAINAMPEVRKGIQSNYGQATKIARAMIIRYGMTDELAMFLYERETITGEEFMEILNREEEQK